MAESQNPPAEGPTPLVSAADRKKIIDRLARVEGQLRGIQRLIERQQDCEIVVQQLAAARGALNKAFAELVGCVIDHRLGSRVEDSKGREALEEIVTLLTKYG